MREFKFRAWWKDTKRFLDGDEWYMTCSGAKHLHYSAYPYSDDDFIIEQYTGLKDKNGKEIYEGDVLESTWNGDKAVVVWNDVEGEWEHYADFNTHSKYSGSVVIGNIHENPELLKEEE